MLLLGIVILGSIVYNTLDNENIVVHTKKEAFIIEELQLNAFEKNTEIEKNSIYCSCVKTVREEGIDIPYGTDAKDLQPNTTPVVGGLVLISYPNIEHVAKILSFNSTDFEIVEGLELSDTGECVKRTRCIPFDYPFIRGFWVPIEMTQISELIIKYANEYGVDESLALNIACAESCTRDKNTNAVYINPTAKNPLSTASGVYQFIESSWNFYCEGDVMNFKDNIECGIRVLAETGESPWEASRTEGFGGGWENEPYFKYAIAN